MINLSKLDLAATSGPTFVRRDSNFLISGKRNSGKTNYLGHLLSYLCNPVYKVKKQSSGVYGSFGKIAVMSETEKFNRYYNKSIGVDKDFIAPCFDPLFLERIVLAQQTLSEALDGNSKRNLKHWMLLILDDVGFDATAQKNTTLKELLFNGRHYMICVVQLVQDALTPLRMVRSCYDFVICTRENTIQGQKRLSEAYFGMMSFEQFKKTMLHATERYGVIVADNTRQAATVTEQYFRDRAPRFVDNSAIGPKPRDFIVLDYSDLEPFRAFIRGMDLSNNKGIGGSGKGVALESQLVASVTAYKKQKETIEK